MLQAAEGGKNMYEIFKPGEKNQTAESFYKTFKYCKSESCLTVMHKYTQQNT